ncbi:DUF6886 family protein [Spirosoma foliorum]|uniref:Uncharacterized protein n=1 Tax=Spirosoma foliorum TaxID=2710596 RepID=A0A7G5GRH6_9BACT|nr:DUF6886 family protein [Spirosoma foliorum]QMW01468.1 hypothetical protein H3H32_26425 [Spirosoma foliorum]
MKPHKLFHISEDPNIRLFKPRPSPTQYEKIKGDVVFAVNDTLLHNYFFPRDCPRVAYFRNEVTVEHDIESFFSTSLADYIITVEASWYYKIKNTTLFCYEFDPETFTLLDENAGYYISYETVKPISVKKIDDLIEELLSRNIELRFTPNLWKLADLLNSSTLGYSMIRLRNARPKVL